VGEELSTRLDAVLQTLYLLFNEGYKASHGDELVRRDLCEEAIRLGEILVQHPAGDRPKTHALVALMLLNAARLAARADAEGNMVYSRNRTGAFGIAQSWRAASSISEDQRLEPN
jgi:RNA polymerase sigma-70 factor (ECF subfamily)